MLGLQKRMIKRNFKNVSQMTKGNVETKTMLEREPA